MKPPSYIRRSQQPSADAREARLRLQLAAEKHRVRLLEQRVADLQAANEGAYRELEQATGGARFDKDRPFGREPRKLGSLPLKGGPE